MNPIIESYLNQDSPNVDSLWVGNAFDNKPNLKKRLEAYAVFLNHLKTQMLRERIISILEKESSSFNFSRHSIDFHTLLKKIMRSLNTIRQHYFLTKQVIYLTLVHELRLGRSVN